MTTSEENSLNTLAVAASSTLTLNNAFNDFIIDRYNYLLVPEAISGSVTQVAANSIVSVTLGDHYYQAEVNSVGNWNVPLPPADIAALAVGAYPLTISVVDNSGATLQQTRVVTRADIADSDQPHITLSPVAGDDLIKDAEQLVSKVLSGSSNGVAEGSLVNITIDGKTWHTTTDANGMWSYTMSVADVMALSQGGHTVGVAVMAADGATELASDSREVTVDYTKPFYDYYPAELTISSVAGDDILTATEYASGLVIHGTTKNIGAGKEIWLQVGDHIYSTKTETLDPSGTAKLGNWQIPVSASDFAALNQGTSTLIAWVNDLDETVTAVRSIYIGDNPQPTVTIDTFLQNFAVDSVSELLVPQWLSGHVTNVEQGNDVQITLGDKQYRARVDSNGEWSLPLAAADLAALTTGSHTLTVTVTNNSGNSAQASQQVQRSDIALDSADSYLAINPLAGDDVLIAQEKASTQYISGVTQGVAAGSVVTITLGGKVYQTSVNDNGDWSLKLPVQDVRALADGEQTITATVAGGSEQISDNRTLLVEHGQGDQWAATVQFAAGTTRSVFDFDRGDGLTLSGSTYSVADGKEVWVQLGDHISSAVVYRNQWHVTINGEDLQQFDHGWSAVRVWVKDLHETASAETSIYFSPDPLPFVTFDTAYQKVTFDSYSDLQTPLVLQGSTSYYSAGSYVDITIGANHYQALVDSIGEWALVLSPAELAALPLGTTTVTASVSNESGQRQNTATFYRDEISEPTGREIYINTIAGDNVLTGRERDAIHVVSGTTYGFTEGEIINVSVYGEIRGYATVDANGAWSFSFPATAIKYMSGHDLQVSVSSTSSEQHPDRVYAYQNLYNDDYSDDSWAQYLAKITIDPVAGDDQLNSAEQQQDLTVSGTVENVADGKPVWVQLGTHVYTTTVQDGKWHTEISADDLAQLNSGSTTLLASVKDLSETASASRSFELTAQSAPQQQSVEIAENDTTDQNALASLTLAALGLSEAPQLADVLVSASNDTSSSENITLPEAPADLWDAAVTASSVAITHDYPVTPLISLAELLEPQTL